MKIGFDAKRAFTNFRGLGNYSRTLIKGLLEVEGNHDFFLYTPKTLPEYEHFFGDDHRAHVVKPEGFLWNSIGSAWRSFGISSDVKSRNIDLFHGLSHEVPMGIHKSVSKVVVTIHDLMYHFFPERFPLIDRISYHQKIGYSLKHSDLVLATCEKTKKDILSVFKDIDPKKIQVVYQAIDHLYFQEDKADLNIDFPYILGVGAFETNKNHEGLIKEFSRIAEKYPEHHLIIIGKGSEASANELKQLAADHYLENRFHLLTDISQELLPLYYRKASLFAFPSFYEGFGIPVIEAMACGCPVVTSEGSGQEEAANGNAFLINPKAKDDLAMKMDMILSDSIKALKLREQGLQWSLNFTPKQVAEKVLNLYSGL